MSDTDNMTREVTLTRVLDAPRNLVWGAWTEPEQLAKWWGPHQFSNPVCEINARPGGRWLIHMKAPDGTVYPMTGTFTEVTKPERLVFKAFAEALDGTKYLESVTEVIFEEQDARTKLTVKAKARGLHPAAPQMLAGMDAGWSQSLERLAALVGATAK
ncbi:MAG: hypothetical protein QOF91_1947 [Alphaproteobacteria bacterium]|nr:hypothetical protein [Alphaproteobacteria bacterium]